MIQRPDLPVSCPRSLINIHSITLIYLKALRTVWRQEVRKLRRLVAVVMPIDPPVWPGCALLPHRLCGDKGVGLQPPHPG